jgi:hypothetical protein
MKEKKGTFLDKMPNIWHPQGQVSEVRQSRTIWTTLRGPGGAVGIDRELGSGNSRKSEEMP